MKPLIVSCPTCAQEVRWLPENRYRPFCSERCKLIDLGAWADERYTVAATEDEPLSDDIRH
ncbi:MAG: DNA gyrase inhibitor YacG [Neisseria sp.]|nr:DNA gyrase inhibitor YacG [Neisseria sp.]